MALEWREAVEPMDMYLRELLSSGLLLLHTELGVDVGLKPELLPPGTLACVVAGLGLMLVLLLWFSVCRCFSKNTADQVASEAVKIFKPKSEEVKKRSRKRGGGDKRLQRDVLTAELDEELNQNQSESLDSAGAKSDKGKKNKKKTKALLKETKSTSERREPEEAGTWETKVSQREKRQQRRKDKGAGDESGSPGGTELVTVNTEHAVAVEEPKIISTPSINTKTTNITTTKTSNTSTFNTSATNTTSNTTKNTNTTSTTSNNTKSSNTTAATGKTSNSTGKTSNNTSSTTSNNTKTSNTTATTGKSSNTTSKISPTPAPKAPKNNQKVQQVAPRELSHVWDVNESGSWDLGVSVPPHSQTWNSVNPEPSVWPQDMEGSWMIVDGSHIPVSLHGMAPGVPELSWPCPVLVNDEWSGPNSSSADPGSDYCAPCEEWGNYEEPIGGAVPSIEPQDSDPEKDNDEPTAPESSKVKKKKKKKKKAEEVACAAQVEVGVAKDQKAAGNALLKHTKDQEVVAPIPVLLKPTEPEARPKSTAPPTQKKPEESLEAQKQVKKKKKARRET